MSLRDPFLNDLPSLICKVYTFFTYKINFLFATSWFRTWPASFGHAFYEFVIIICRHRSFFSDKSVNLLAGGTHIRGSIGMGIKVPYCFVRDLCPFESLAISDAVV